MGALETYLSNIRDTKLSGEGVSYPLRAGEGSRRPRRSLRADEFSHRHRDALALEVQTCRAARRQGEPGWVRLVVALSEGAS